MIQMRRLFVMALLIALLWPTALLAQEPAKTVGDTVVAFFKTIDELDRLMNKFIANVGRGQALAMVAGLRSDLNILRTDKTNLQRELRKNAISKARYDVEVDALEAHVMKLQGTLRRFSTEIARVSTLSGMKLDDTLQSYMETKLEDVRALRDIKSLDRDGSARAVKMLDVSLQPLDQAITASESLLETIDKSPP